jgi:hypothetical protein
MAPAALVSAVLATTAAAAAALAASPPQQREVDRYSVRWATPPTGDAVNVPVGRPSPPSGPFVGNGDVSLLYSGNATSVGSGRHAATIMDWQQWLYLSKNDMWGSDRVDYYPHLSAGRIGILVAPPAGGAAGVNASVEMFPGNASISHTLAGAAGVGTVAATTRVLENNAVVTTLVCTSKSGAACPVELLLSDTDGNHFGVSQDAGAAPDGKLVWWRKENLHEALNGAYVGSCDPHHALQSVERSFTVAADGALQMVNGSCLWAAASADGNSAEAAPGATVITSGDCKKPQGGWKWKGSASKGDIVHTASSKCLSASSLSLGACGTSPWAQAPSGSENASHVYLSTGATGRNAGCLVVVPDNNNNTLGVALGVADASGSLLPGKTARVSANDSSAGITLSLSLKSGEEYTLLAGLQTLRDTGCAGIRPQWEACTVPPQDAAAALVRAMAPTAARGAAVANSLTFWETYWAASSVDLTAGAASAPASVASVERWYYLAQYLLGTTTRDGKVTSALNGFVW